VFLCVQHLLLNKDHLEIEHAAVLALIDGDNAALNFLSGSPLEGNLTRSSLECAPNGGHSINQTDQLMGIQVLQAFGAMYLSPQLDQFFVETERERLRPSAAAGRGHATCRADGLSGAAKPGDTSDALRLKEAFALRRSLWRHLVAPTARRDQARALPPLTPPRATHAHGRKAMAAGGSGAARAKAAGCDSTRQGLDNVQLPGTRVEGQHGTGHAALAESGSGHTTGHTSEHPLPQLHVRMDEAQRQGALAALRRVEQCHGFVPSAVDSASTQPLASSKPSPAAYTEGGRPVADDARLPVCKVHKESAASWGVPNAAGDGAGVARCCVSSCVWRRVWSRDHVAAGAHAASAAGGGCCPARHARDLLCAAGAREVTVLGRRCTRAAPRARNHARARRVGVCAPGSGGAVRLVRVQSISCSRC